MTTSIVRDFHISQTTCEPRTSRRTSIWALLRPRVEQLALYDGHSPWLAVSPLNREEVNTARVLLTRHAQTSQPDQRTWRFKTRYSTHSQTLYICKVTIAG